mmetsp:Transcript_48237/g.148936  ORF Transcript_48237/g.148936 Transcript_48237/m.148936 type:complete len:330 (-) Transcript_48237:324-1313(-)
MDAKKAALPVSHEEGNRRARPALGFATVHAVVLAVRARDAVVRVFAGGAGDVRHALPLAIRGEALRLARIHPALGVHLHARAVVEDLPLPAGRGRGHQPVHAVPLAVGPHHLLRRILLGLRAYLPLEEAGRAQLQVRWRRGEETRPALLVDPRPRLEELPVLLRDAPAGNVADDWIDQHPSDSCDAAVGPHERPLVLDAEVPELVAKRGAEQPRMPTIRNGGVGELGDAVEQVLREPHVAVGHHLEVGVAGHELRAAARRVRHGRARDEPPVQQERQGIVAARHAGGEHGSWRLRVPHLLMRLDKVQPVRGRAQTKRQRRAHRWGDLTG